MPAQSSFNPLTSSTEGWEVFLLKDKHHARGRTDPIDKDWPPKTELQKVLLCVNEAQVTAQKRKSITARVVEASVRNWYHLASFKIDPRSGGAEPFLEIASIGGTCTNPDPELLSCKLRLWHDAPIDFDPKESGFIKLFRGFNEQVPLGNKEIENLYLEHFGIYKFTALETLLRRGDLERAHRLFLAQVKDFPFVDPWCMDHLIYHGLPVGDAKVWLKQKEDGGEGRSASHMKHVLERWAETAPQ